MSDSAFLAEVEDFLTSCDLPVFPSTSLYLPDESQESVVKNESLKTRRRKSTSALSDAAKRELEKAKDRKRRSAYRERRRLERESLQQQVNELSTTLAELEKGDSLLASSWKTIAERQLQARLSAEKQQRELVAAIDGRAKMIRDFQEFVRTRLSSVATLEQDALDGELYTHKRIRVEPSDEELFKLYIQEMDDQYVKVDEYMRLCGVDSLSADEEHKHQWKEDGATGYFLYGNKEVVPYDFHKTCQYAWRAARMAHRQESRQDFEDVVDPENTAAFKFRVTTRLKSGRVVSVFQRAVVRRYQEENRHVIVWRFLSEGEGMFAGMHADEWVCCVSTPIETESTRGTLTRTAMRYVPMHFSRSAAEEPALKDFTGMLLDTGTEDSTVITNKIKSLLLEDA